jgi:hypothetical protein
MASSANLRIAALVALGLVAPAALVVACSSSSSNPTPTTPVYNTGDDGGDATTTEPTDDGGNTSPEASAGDSGGDGGTTPDAASDAAPACTSALSDAGCYVCPGTTVQFLNQCSATGVQCTGFNNLSRLPSYDGGALAPLN